MGRTVAPWLGLIPLALSGCQSTTPVSAPKQAEEVSNAIVAELPNLLPVGSRVVFLQASIPSRWPGQAICGWIAWETADGQRMAAPYVSLKKEAGRKTVVANSAEDAVIVHEHCVVPQLTPSPA